MHKLIICLIFYFISVSFCFAQETINPTVTYILDLSASGKEKLEKGKALFDTEIKTESDKKLLEEYDKFTQSGSGFENGCSWYCGGDVQEITASSTLSSQGTVNYVPKNLHDFNLNTAWVEGKDDYGIGEYIEYKFKENSPRVTTLYIYNGYMKSQTAWEENSRVKKIKLYFDKKLYKILNLKNNTGIQKFEIGSPFSSSTHPAYTLKFEIAEIYPGKKYKDVAITEIDLEGLDVHCVNSGSKIQLANGNDINIEKLKTNDNILVYDLDKKEYCVEPIKQVKIVNHNTLYRIKTKSSVIEISADHPILTEIDDFLTINKSNNYRDLISKSIGIHKENKLKFERIIDIEKICGDFKTYTLILKSNKKLLFIANKVLVSSEK